MWKIEIVREVEDSARRPKEEAPSQPPVPARNRRREDRKPVMGETLANFCNGARHEE